LIGSRIAETILGMPLSKKIVFAKIGSIQKYGYPYEVNGTDLSS
jgi:hypothetical protein